MASFDKIEKYLHPYEEVILLTIFMKITFLLIFGGKKPKVLTFPYDFNC